MGPRELFERLVGSPADVRLAVRQRQPGLAEPRQPALAQVDGNGHADKLCGAVHLALRSWRLGGLWHSRQQGYECLARGLDRQSTIFLIQKWDLRTSPQIVRAAWLWHSGGVRMLARSNHAWGCSPYTFGTGWPWEMKH